MNPTEKQIIVWLRQGDKKAIEAIYDRYAGSLFGVLMNMLKNEDAAKEVLQESMIKVWKNGKKYDPAKAKLFTWLLRIVRNKAIDFLRSQKTRSDYEIQIATSNVSNNKVFVHPEHMDVADHLDKLEPKYREVLRALFYSGMTQQEVSDHYAIPLGTVKTRLKIGLRELRKIFDEPSILVFFALLLFS